MPILGLELGIWFWGLGRTEGQRELFDGDRPKARVFALHRRAKAPLLLRIVRAA